MKCLHGHVSVENLARPCSQPSRPLPSPAMPSGCWTILAQPDSNCCYARSDKHWSLDPNGIAWEAFHTLDATPTYGERGREATEAAASGCGCSLVQKLASTVAAKASSCC